ncbi:unnamed protein product [Coregonus sp. 'balchen']|nr:unnamed protein product [Coregonus sp. 'balchen']
MKKEFTVCFPTEEEEAVHDDHHIDEPDIWNDLEPFAEATDITQGEKVVTISAVVPSILSLHHHLETQKPQVSYLTGLVRSLQASLKRRLIGIFINVKMATPSGD